jgi:DNA-binding MarR family transcriptional regulator
MEKKQVDFYLKQLEDIFHELLKRIQAELSRTMTHNITPSQFLVLKKLAEGRATVSELADFLGVSLSAITSLVDRLNKSGFVTRIRDEQDRRLVWLEMTSQGSQELNECLSKRNKVMHTIFGQLEEDDLQNLIVIYGKVSNIIKQIQVNETQSEKIED